MVVGSASVVVVPFVVSTALASLTCVAVLVAILRVATVRRCCCHLFVVTLLRLVFVCGRHAELRQTGKATSHINLSAKQDNCIKSM